MTSIPGYDAWKLRTPEEDYEMNGGPSRDEARGLYRPTPAETFTACETLLRADLPREARAVVREILERTETDNVQHRT